MKLNACGLDFSRYRLPRLIPKPYVFVVSKETPVYVEIRTGVSDTQLFVLAGIDYSAPGVLKLKLVRHEDIVVDFNMYNVTWRCWTSRPSEGTSLRQSWSYDCFSESIEKVRTRNYAWALPNDYDENW